MVYTAELFGVPTKTLMDPVHGSIPIYSHEQLLIDTPLFQRLRHILQNDVVFLVFPGAKHNRLLHSIGTMHMASTLFTKITSRHLAQIQFKDLSEVQRKSIQYLHCCVRLAALLHDIGHFPFSHQFEECDAVAPFLKPSLLQELWGAVSGDAWKLVYEIDKEKKKISHEDFSVRIAYEILTKSNVLSEVDFEVRDILFFLENSKNVPSNILKSHCENIIQIPLKNENIDLNPNIIKSFLNYLKSFISGELDADKMDYILRDSYFSGCRYGMYNKDHLLNSLRVGYEPFFDKGGNLYDVDFSLAILEKGMGALEDFVYARYQLYLELYNHKTVSGLRKLLSLAIGEILSSKEAQKEIKDILLDVNKFSNFTDTFFWEKFRRYANINPNSASYRLINRQKLKYVMKFENQDQNDIDLFCERHYERNGVRIGYWKSKIKFSEISPKFKSIKVLLKNDTNPKQPTYELKKLSEETDFFTKFQRQEIYHLFEIPEELVIPIDLDTIGNKKTADDLSSG
jgi:HD superfamily phosphohydrolase